MSVCSLSPKSCTFVILLSLLYLFLASDASITNEQDESKSNSKQLLSVQQLYQPSSNSPESRNLVDEILNGVSRRPNRPSSTSTVFKCDVKTKPCFNKGICYGGNCICPPNFSGRFCELCAGRVNQIGESGFITDGLSNFTKNIKCMWILEDNSKQNSSLNFHYLTFRFERFNTECCEDFLQVLDGDSAFSPKLAALSGYETSERELQYKLKSRSAFLFFRADKVSNTSGFNISYQFTSCVEDCSKFPSGFCDPKSHKCNCKSSAADNETITHLCSNPSCKKFCKHGQCSPKNFCNCEDNYTGQFCNISTKYNRLWTEMHQDSPIAKSGHDLVLLDDDLFLIGGENFDNEENLTISRYNFLSNAWTKYNSTHFYGHVPKNRFGHAVVAFNDAIYIFGGSFSDLNVTNELLRLDIVYENFKNLIILDSSSNNSSSAENFTDREKIISKFRFTMLHEHTNGQSSGSKIPMNVFGHTCHVIGKSMLVFGGYNPFRGFMNFVQEYTFANDSWTIIETSGARVPGFAGHASVLDPTNNFVYIFGGYSSQPRQTFKVYDHLLLYQSPKRKWLWLQESGLPTYFHSASLLNNLMIVVGGYTRNYTTKGNCFQEVVQIFDLGCSDWHYMDIREQLPRIFGHKAVVYKKRIYIFGGFDGRFSNRVQKFTPVDCSSLSTEEDCKFNAPASGAKCGFYKGQCQSLFESDLFSKSKFPLDSVQSSLLDKSRKENVDVMVTPHAETEDESATCKRKKPVDKNYCDRFDDCESCMSSLVKSCNWCEDTKKCSASTCEGSSQSFSNSNDNFCPAPRMNCTQLHSCIACRFYENCVWKPQPKRPEWSTCVDVDQIDKGNDFAALLMTKDQMNSLCYRPCQMLASCESCTKARCSWCATTKKCLDTSSQPFFYSYGQCSSWAMNTDECSALQDCQYHLTCAKCQAAGPQCGWCDDGSQTGLGRCMEGGLGGPLTYPEMQKASGSCPANRWHFTSCPACQCNGHSTCIPFPKRTSADPLRIADDPSSSTLAPNFRKPNESLWRHHQVQKQRSASASSWKKNRGGNRLVVVGGDDVSNDEESSFKATTDKIMADNFYHRYDNDDMMIESSTMGHPLVDGRVFKALLMSKTSTYSKTPPPKTSDSDMMCKKCAHRTTGEQCERCQDGFHGNALNGGNCTACECNNHAQLCHPLTGRCYCSTKGIVGHRCERCDSKYIGNPLNSTCYYEVFVDYSFAFNLNNEEDVFVDRINFISKPTRPDIDVTFKITCSVWSDDAIGRIDLNITNDFDLARGFPPRRLMKGEACGGTTIQKIYSTDQFHFGTDINTTFYVTVYGFRSPLSIQVSFAQTQNIDWMRFFVTFALCFFVLLVVAFALWKVKQKIDLYRRRQRLFVEMAQMASRPFGVMTLDWSHTKPPKKQYPTAVAVEPCENFRAAVVTVALKMPTGGRPYPPVGQPGLALASALCYMTPAQVLQLQTSPTPQMEEKTPKRRRPTCIS